MRKNYTLLYTDVVDSTAVNSRLGDAGMALLWNEHDRRSRELLRQWRGSEIDRSDGFLVLFDGPPDAVAFALAYHRMLTTLPVPLRARAGMHVGPLVKRESTPSDVQLGAKPVEVVGIAKAITARLMTLALGGQTLLSPSAHSTLQAEGVLDGAWRSVSHGHWRMKGLEQVVEVFEVGDEHSAFVPPADSDKSQRVVQMRNPGAAAGAEGTWVGVREVPHNLPAERDSFVGRGEELKTVAQAFADGARLLTVCGPGGMGKTRLVLRYAWSWLGDYPGGVWFCDLASARTGDGLLYAVAQAMDVPLGQDPTAQLGRAIAGRGTCLVILDNFEQLRRLARDTLGHWLDAAPHARFIVTSREVLSLPGERTQSLAPLSADDAAALFHQRARAAHASHDPSAEPDATRDLVDLLDGMPLAIELAAPRVRVMPTPELLSRMGNRFRLLAASGGRPDRQATLRATLAWSWDLLSPDERSVLAQLSVFEGGFDWPAVQTVVTLGGSDAEADDAPWIIDLLQSLVDKSLVTPQLGARFRLLRSVKEFAAEELAREGSFPGSGAALARATRQRHCQHFAALTDAQVASGRCIELDNLARACEHAVEDGHVDLAVPCLRLASTALSMVGPFSASADLAAKVHAMPQAQSRHRLWASHVDGLAQLALGDRAKARAAARRVLAALQDVQEQEAEVAAHSLAGEVEMGAGDLETAARHLAHARRCATELGSIHWRLWVLNSQGAMLQYQGLYAQSRDCYKEALSLAFDEGSHHFQASLLGNLAGLHFQEGHLDKARGAYEQSLKLAREAGSRRLEGDAHCNLGIVCMELGLLDLAGEELALALETAQKLGYARLTHVVSCNLGLLEETRGNLAAASVYFEAARDGARSSGEARSEAQYSGYLAQALCQLDRHAAAQQSVEHGLGLLAQQPDAFSMGLLTCAQADLLHRQGAFEASRAALEEVTTSLAANGWDANSELGRRLQRTVARHSRP